MQTKLKWVYQATEHLRVPICEHKQYSITNKKAVLSQRTTARCGALVLKAITPNSQEMQWIETTRTIGKHEEVAEKNHFKTHSLMHRVKRKKHQWNRRVSHLQHGLPTIYYFSVDFIELHKIWQWHCAVVSPNIFVFSCSNGNRTLRTHDTVEMSGRHFGSVKVSGQFSPGTRDFGTDTFRH